MITQSGHVVMVSGLVLTIAYASMLVLPGAFKSFSVAAASMILRLIFITFFMFFFHVFGWFMMVFKLKMDGKTMKIDEHHVISR